MSLDWHQIFGLTMSPLELIVRGSAIYLLLFLLFRVIVKRRVGSIGMADLLVLVIIADAAQNGMSGQYRTVSEAAILVGTILGWNVLIDFLVFRVPKLRSLLEPPPLLLVENGRLIRAHLRQEFLSEGELRSKLREQGVEELREVSKAYLEPDGQMSVFKIGSNASRARPKPRRQRAAH